MREWVEETVATIAAHGPRRILEIGCGTGLLLYRLAKDCERYVATDFSQKALDRVYRKGPCERNHGGLRAIATDEENPSHVHGLCCLDGQSPRPSKMCTTAVRRCPATLRAWSSKCFNVRRSSQRRSR